jgi:HEPN domain-containing protein
MAERDIIKQWITLADMDLNTADFLAKNMFPPPLEIICFHCQQAAEKYLKGFLEFHDETPPRIHDIIELQKKCENYDPDFIKLEEFSKALTNFGVQPRYDLGMDIQKSDMLLSLKYAQSIKTFVQLMIPEFFQDHDQPCP